MSDEAAVVATRGNGPMTNTVPAHSPRPAPSVSLSDSLRATFRTGLTRPIDWRCHQLGELVRLLRREAGTLTDAMAADLGKPELEGWLTDVAAVRRDIEGILHHLGGWAAPRPVRVPWTLWPGRAQIIPEPLGAVLIVAPWNYPVRCLVLPLAFAIAAGNTVAVKPSELAPTTSAALAKLLPSYLDARAIEVAEGGPDVAESLLDQRWDHIFFTGSGRVGTRGYGGGSPPLDPGDSRAGGQKPRHRRRLGGPRRRCTSDCVGEVPERRPDLRGSRLRGRPRLRS